MRIGGGHAQNGCIPRIGMREKTCAGSKKRVIGFRIVLLEKGKIALVEKELTGRQLAFSRECRKHIVEHIDTRISFRDGKLQTNEPVVAIPRLDILVHLSLDKLPFLYTGRVLHQLHNRGKTSRIRLDLVGPFVLIIHLAKWQKHLGLSIGNLEKDTLLELVGEIMIGGNHVINAKTSILAPAHIGIHLDVFIQVDLGLEGRRYHGCRTVPKFKELILVPGGKMILFEKFVSRIVVLLDRGFLGRLKIGIGVRHEVIRIECFLGVHFIICQNY